MLALLVLTLSISALAAESSGSSDVEGIKEKIKGELEKRGYGDPLYESIVDDLKDDQVSGIYNRRAEIKGLVEDTFEKLDAVDASTNRQELLHALGGILEKARDIAKDLGIKFELRVGFDARNGNIQVNGTIDLGDGKEREIPTKVINENPNPPTETPKPTQSAAPTETPGPVGNGNTGSVTGPTWVPGNAGFTAQPEANENITPTAAPQSSEENITPSAPPENGGTANPLGVSTGNESFMLIAVCGIGIAVILISALRKVRN